LTGSGAIGRDVDDWCWLLGKKVTSDYCMTKREKGEAHDGCSCCR